MIVGRSCVAVALDSTDVWSWHPQNRPGVRHVVLVVAVGVGDAEVVVVVVVLVVVLSLHPNQPLHKVSAIQEGARCNSQHTE